MELFQIISYILLFLLLFFLIRLVYPFIYLKFFVRSQNLQEKYDATWALITGSSSGLGLILAERLAKQKINLLLLSDDLESLRTQCATLRKNYPAIKVESLCIDMSQPVEAFIQRIEGELQKKPISLLFNNVGYMPVFDFASSEWNQVESHINCTVTNTIQLTHAVVNSLYKRKRIGAIVFTSSIMSFIPTPYSTLYSSTKSYISAFAQSLAIETKKYNIDVCVVQPGPISKTNFLKATGIDNFDKDPFVRLLYSFSQTPKQIINLMLQSIGKFTVIGSSPLWGLVRAFQLVCGENIILYILTKTSTLWGLGRSLKKKSN
ncbi:oxidoreductase [Anaeramoeba flamelloides]|uniref:Oxidoreductase n=1 Tax=Anaeramoeba flamelloides TaxID=1746091 RepID=A0ABQ8Z833_9EUKA|nr:oxidoreductase [Anaeramoeba flamelloides]